MKLKVGDRVRVLSGKDRGKEGSITRVIKEKERVIVEGMNMVKKHQKATGTVRQGGIIDREMPMHVSNVAFIGTDGKPTRVGYQIKDDGSKVRIDRKTGNII